MYQLYAPLKFHQKNGRVGLVEASRERNLTNINDATVVGPLNYHHQLDCVVTQAGPAIQAFCGGVLKQGNGDFGSGPTCKNFLLGVIQSG